MKQLLISILILFLFIGNSFSQGLQLEVGEEFEYCTSVYGNVQEDKKPNTILKTETYNQTSYKFKVTKTTKKGYTLHCKSLNNISYAREKSSADKQWTTSTSRHLELENPTKSNYVNLDFEFECVLSPRGELLDFKFIKMIDKETYNQHTKYLPSKEALTAAHKKRLEQFFFDKTEWTTTNKVQIDSVDYNIISDRNNLLTLTTNIENNIEYKTTISKYRKQTTTNYKGKKSEHKKVLIDKKSGLINEVINDINTSLIINNNPNLRKEASSTIRTVLIRNCKEEFPCHIINDGKKEQTTLFNTNVRIQGKIKNPDPKRKMIALRWDVKEPSAYKVMGMMVPLKNDNSFEFKLKIDKLTKFTLAHKGKVDIYLLPGDDIQIDIDADNFTESLFAYGIGAHHVNFCFDRTRYDLRNKSSLKTVGRKLFDIKRTASPESFEKYAFSKLKVMQSFVENNKKFISPEVYLANYWSNQCEITENLRSYTSSINYWRTKDSLPEFNIDKHNYPKLDSLIHVDNDLMMFADNYDSFIREYVFFYLRENLSQKTGRGKVIYNSNYLDNIHIKNYNFADAFFTGKTQEALKYNAIKDALRQSSWNTYEILHSRYLDDYPNSSRREILKDTYNKSKKVSTLSPAFNFKLKDLEGKTHQLSDYRGKAVYLHFWSLNCGTDDNIESNFNKVHDKFADSSMVFIHILFGTKKQAQHYIKENKQKGIFLLASGQVETQIRREYFFTAVPHYCIIDTNGNIVLNKNNSPYQILQEPELMNDALSPTALSVDYQHRSQLMTYISLGLLCLLVLAAGTILWIKRNNARKLKLAHLNQELRESELKAIRALMNPHFMHNCLNAIQNLVQKKELDKAHLYISKFATLIRHTLTLSDKQEVSLSQELEMINNYVALEQLRFALDYQVDISSEIDSYSVFIPPMLLQPIVENAIIHGLAQKEDNRKLQISIFSKEELIFIKIKDNGIGRNASKAQQSNGTGKGHSFTKERLELLKQKYGNACQMNICDLYDGKQATGTKVEIIIEDEA